MMNVPWKYYLSLFFIVLLMSIPWMLDGHIIKGIYQFIWLSSLTAAFLPQMKKPLKLIIFTLFIILWLVAAYIDFVDKKAVMAMGWLGLALFAIVLIIMVTLRDQQKIKQH